jgi:hypothetical protein
MFIEVVGVWACGHEESLMHITLDEIDKIAGNDIATKEGSTTPKVSLSFELTRSHLLKVNKAEVKFDELVREEIKPNVNEIVDDFLKD